MSTTTPETAAATAGVAQVLANVTLVNATVAAVGGVAQAKQAAEAIRACGGPDAFVQYLNLIADIQAGGA